MISLRNAPSQKNRKSVAVFCVIVIGSLLCGAFAQETNSAKPAETLTDLQSRLTNHVAQRRFAAAMWGVKVVSLDTGKTLYEHNAGKLFSPASNSKLYTCALALDRLWPDYRIRTSLYSQARPDRLGTLNGDLIVYGRGDPTINARLNGSDIFKALEPLVAALTNAGVKRIKGDLIGDESFFRGPPFGSGWAWDDMENYYGAEISALTINDNLLQLNVKPGGQIGAPCELKLKPATPFVIISNRTETVAKDAKRRISLYRPLGGNVTHVRGQMPMEDSGSNEDVMVHNPAGLFVALFKEALARRGIKVSGRVRTADWLAREATPLDLASLIELGAVESLPLRDIVREIQKPSQNLYTDLLLAHVGALAQATNTSAAKMTSEDAGIEELDRFLARIGIEKGNVFFEEGSGLSRNNLTTPNAMVRLLEFMSRHSSADVYRDALPIAGVDGTLKSRMKDTPAAGNMRAKTGTLRWANSLSGHVTTAAGERLIFSIMLNRYHSTEPNRSTRAEIDAIAVMLAGFTGHSSKEKE
jgi:D-alanyl-D-alanine carboxypeptidase/D-alanyl-D-alanine-endopeptidase (penicillin-binding protein 4)